MASEKVYFSLTQEEVPFRVCDIKDHFERAGHRFERVRVYIDADSKRVYGVLYFRATTSSLQFLQNDYRIRGIPLHVHEHPNTYHKVLDDSDESIGASILWLNDFCLQKVFSYLMPEDLCNVAEVCDRFKSNAQSQFSSRRMKIEWSRDSMQTSPSSLRFFTRLLHHFGPFVTALKITSKHRLADVLKLLLLHCGPTLTKLTLRGIKLRDGALLQKFVPIIRHLRKLKIQKCSDWFLSILSNASELESINLFEILSSQSNANEDVDAGADVGAGTDVNHFDSLCRNYPRLTNVTFAYVENLTSEQIVRFLQLNPQLKRAEIPLDHETILDTMVENVSHIEELDIDAGDLIAAEPLGQLKALRRLRLTDFDRVNAHIVSSVLHTVATANLPLEFLSFTEVTLTNADVENICKLTSIRSLHFVDYGKATFAQMIKIGKHLKNIAELEIRNSFALTLDEITQLICCYQKMSGLELQDVNIDVDAFTKIVNIVLQREQKIPLQIQLENCCDTEKKTPVLPKEITDAHRQWLTIEESMYHVIDTSAFY